jgi:anhydro-N-acetylmuramic acid kinase
MWHHPTRTRALQNIGGIANVTYLPAGGGPESVIAFDTGPGNVLIDDIAAQATGGAWRCDRDGALAARGRVNEGLLARLLDHAYLRQPPPKSTGRETFGAAFAADLWERAQARGLTPADLVATVTAFTAASIADAHRRWLPAPPDEVFLCGGGADNPTLVRMLRERLDRAFGDAVPVVRHYDDTGYSSEAKEAVAFAILAYETWHGRPGNLPQVTGASCSVILGHVTPVPGSHTPPPSRQ